MPGWFDINSLDFKTTVDDRAGMFSSVAAVNQIIDREVRESSINRNRIVVGGFSQGGAIALLTGLADVNETKLAGVVGLSTWLPPSFKDSFMKEGLAARPPILMCHGDSDEVVNPLYHNMTIEALHQLDVTNVQQHIYPGLGRSSCQDEMMQVITWLKSVIP